MRRDSRRVRVPPNSSGRRRRVGPGELSPHTSAGAAPPIQPVDGEEGLFDEPVGGLRHIRLWSGLLLIGLAAVMIVLSQLLGVASQDSTPRATPASSVLPSLVTAIERSDFSVTVRLVERRSAVAGLSAKTGNEFLVLDVLVTNKQQWVLSVDYTDFHILDGGHVVCTAGAYPGHAGSLHRRLAPGQSTQGALICPVPLGEKGLVFAYVPEDGSHAQARWIIG